MGTEATWPNTAEGSEGSPKALTVLTRPACGKILATDRLVDQWLHWVKPAAVASRKNADFQAPLAIARARQDRG